MDADPEVYRLGYGDQAALEPLHEAMTANGLALARQPGIRIGLMVADERMLVYSPVPRLIEAASPNPEKPNAVIISGQAARQVMRHPRGPPASVSLTVKCGPTALIMLGSFMGLACPLGRLC
ncbi:hypothetical protein [Novosphingobium sp.]|uniref:hypothetical protein n=1 Tax=Novosphingobium sp. TaxID=1874826 RepID=UPI00260A06F0|nr:hypothetical protein [Novosphingobium sp.]